MITTSQQIPPASVDDAVRTMLRSQYHSALGMLREAVELCPEELWYDDGPTNAFWQVAYHALFFAHFYLQPNAAAFRPWSRHQSHVQHEDGIAGPPNPESDLPLIPNPYSRAEVMEYWAECSAMVDEGVTALDLWSEDSGFWWYRVPKLEHQMVNIRHIQHHAAQLADRLRSAGDHGVKWIGSSRGG